MPKTGIIRGLSRALALALAATAVLSVGQVICVRAASGQDVSSTADIVLSPGCDHLQVTGTPNVQVQDANNQKGWKLTEETTLTLDFSAPKNEDYVITLSYLPLPGTGNEIELELKLNEKTGSQQLDSVSLKRTWENDGKNRTDAAGNQIRPVQKEVYVVQTQTLRDPLENDPAKYGVVKGQNRLMIHLLREPMLLLSIQLSPQSALPSYDAYRAKLPSGGQTASLTVEGESAARKSDATLYAVSDRSSPSNSPSDPSKILLNTVGGTNWRYMQQWIEWDLQIPKDGWYHVSMRLKQNERMGQNASRKLYVDGQIPFDSCNSITIPYSSGWQFFTIGKGETPIYLTKGQHTIRLENTIGAIGNVLQDTKALIAKLNTLYRSILVYIGSSPDADRDYQLNLLIPNLKGTFQTLISQINQTKAKLLTVTGQEGEDYAQFADLERQLRLFVKNENKIPAQFDLFRTNISALSEWLLRAQEQPVLLDRIELTTSKDLSRQDAGFFASLWFDMQAFISSFSADYNALTATGTAQDTVTVWIGSGVTNAAGAAASGRDQANAIKSVIDSYFTPQSGIAVNLKLVDGNSLIPAVATNNGPDLTMFQSTKSVMDYGFRGALQDLSGYEGLSATLEGLNDAASEPFVYQGKRYALPDSYSFSLMFYRKDILGHLGLEVPETWTDVSRVLPQLNNNYLTIGLPSLVQDSIELFTTILYQKGGAAYNQDGTKALFASKAGVEAFEQWGDFYTKYSVPQKLDLLTYFRTGQTPLIIAPYTFYNNLAAGAPEIEGLWGATLVPGTIAADGTVSHAVTGASTGAVIFANSKKKQTAWKFLKWWVSDTAQYRYGVEVETTLGAAGRIATANLKAFSKLPWSKQAYVVISNQMEKSKALPEVPGGYMATRYLPTAMRLVVNDGIYPRDALISYTQLINEEITTKRKEFHLDS